MATINKECLSELWCKSKKNAPVVVNNLSAADEIKKYKELLDLGIITQEEFDQKKKQLLNL